METGILEKLLNGLSLTDFAVYSIMALFGFIFSVFAAFCKAKNFNLKTWWEKERFRILLNISAIPLGIIFQEQVTGTPVSLLGALEAGFITDVIVDRFITRKSITKQL